MNAANTPLPIILPWCRRLAEEADRMALELDVDDINTDDLHRLWDTATRLTRTLQVFTRDVAVELGERIAATDGETINTPGVGPAHIARRPTERWDGAKVLRMLSSRHVNPDTGDIIEAVPLHVLADVLPAVRDGQTSSKWRSSGLTAHGLDPDEYRDREWSHPLPQPGEPS